MVGSVSLAALLASPLRLYLRLVNVYAAVAPSSIMHGGKKLTARQERVLSVAYGDYVRKRTQAKEDNRPWKSKLLEAMQEQERQRSNSLTSEDLTQVLDALDSSQVHRSRPGIDAEAVAATSDCRENEEEEPNADRFPTEMPRTKLARNATKVLSPTEAALAEVLEQLEKETGLNRVEIATTWTMWMKKFHLTSWRALMFAIHPEMTKAPMSARIKL
ncbi:unnamed protein product [Phytophthora fragariaefolia]|uniref:Unnamed protein product n=1 Tax=Phytophthora fragariaefolia TaxID=1490495 RepID=A0A9W7CLH4_9STRA|nr:unnamed protein product [Phytophthora fragariaefolia]